MRKAALSLILLLTAAGAAAGSLEAEIATVERIRGLKFRHDVKSVRVGRDEITERLQAQIAKAMPYSLDEYILVLRSLHLVDGDGDDLEQRLFSLLEQQVLAWYDPLSHVYYDIDEPAAGLPAIVPTSLIAVHELTHALQDQHFEIGRRDLALRDDWDASLAYHAVIEGEATLVMMAALMEGLGASLDDVVKSDLFGAKLAEVAGQAGMIDESAPRYFVESLKFPYLAGLTLVTEAYRRGGWKAVDGLHANPPRSTREVIHMDEYFARLGGAPTSSSALVARIAGEAAGVPRRSALTTIRLGEFHWSFLLGEKNARGWRSDEVTVVQNAECDPTVLVATEWDSPAQAAAFASACEQFLLERAKGLRVTRKGSGVRIAWGADASLIEKFTR